MFSWELFYKFIDFLVWGIGVIASIITIFAFCKVYNYKDTSSIQNELNKIIKDNNSYKSGLAMEINTNVSISELYDDTMRGIKAFKYYAELVRKLQREKGIIDSELCIGGHNWPEHLENNILILIYKYYCEKSKNEDHQNIFTERELTKVTEQLKNRQKTSNYWD